MEKHTLTEVARRAGVSAATVSRVVNNAGNVKQETRERVLDAIRVHGYVPNQVARSLKMSRSSAVGVVIPDISDSYFAGITKSLEARLSRRGYSMILCISNEDAEKERKYIDFIRQNMIDGVVVATVAHFSDAHEHYLDSGRSMVFIDNLPAFSRRYSAVITDNAAAGRLAVDHLASLGHKNIGVIAGKQDETTGAERVRGYLRAMDARGLAVRPGWVRQGDFKWESGYAGLAAMLAENPEVTAVCVHSSQMTYGAYRAMEERGLRAPADLSVVGFDVYDHTGVFESAITSVVQQEEEMGRIACDMLLDAIENGPEPSWGTVVLEARLAVRQSAAPPTR